MILYLSSMEVNFSKPQLRKIALSYRRLLSEGEYLRRNSFLMNSIQDFLQKRQERVLHLFISIKRNKEPDFSGMLPWLWKQGFKTMVSKTNFQSQTLKHFYLTNTIALQENKKGIPEPIPEESMAASPMDAEIIFVPLLVVDKSGNRIGYGGGYYDRMLEETKAIKIGLSLANPVDKIPQIDHWDISLNFLITPYNIYIHG